MRRTKSSFLLAVLAAAAVFIFTAPVFSAEQARDFKNNELKYSVKYPANFQLKPLGKVIVFISPDSDKKTGFSPSVNIAAESMRAPAPALEEFFRLAKEKLVSGEAEVKILDEKKDKLSGVDSYKIIYTSKQKKTNFKLLQVISIYKGKAYLVTYTALSEQYDRSLAQANSILRSFKFLD